MADINKNPVPVDVGSTTTIAPLPIDRRPKPVPAGPGSTGQITTAPTPVGPPESAPAPLPPGPGTGQRTANITIPAVPVVELPVDTANTANNQPNIVAPVQNYITVLANGVITVKSATALNFTGSGAQITAVGSTAVINITGGGNAALGNWAFTGNTQYNINGGVINNSDLTHGSTAGLTIPGNGSNSAVSLLNYYGDVAVIAATSPGTTKSWTFANNGNLVFPDNSGSSWPINQQRFGMGNIGAWLDGQWTIGEFSGNGVSGTVGIRIDPAIEGNTGITIPSQADSVTQRVSIYNTGGGGIELYTGANNWEFGSDGNLTLPNNANIATIGNVTQINTGANGFLSLNSFDASGNNIARVGVDSIDKVVFIGVSDPGAEIDYTWGFGNGGGTLFPTLDVQRGDNPSGTITGQTLLFGNPLQEAIISTPDGYSEAEYSQRLVINPGAGYDFGEGGDIYLWAGRGGNGSGSGGDIKIRGGQGGANTMGGSGGSGGYIRIEAGDAATTGGVPGYIDMNAGVNYVGAGGYVAVQGGQGQTIGGDANIRGGYGVDDRGGNVNIWGGGTGNGQVNEGYVNIQTGGNTWTFDSTGNLTLPANTFAVKYANGTQVSLGGGSTGNVTFNNQVVQGTGDDSGGGGLYLAPGTASTANLQYLRVRGGDYITHIHLDTGNNAYYDQYFGDDSKYVKLEGTGNVSVQASDYVNGGANTATWVFGTDGSVTIPGAIVGNGNLHLQPDPANPGAYLDIYLTYGPDIHIAKTDSNVIIGGDSAANVTVNATGNVSIQSWNGTANVWNFSADGVLFAPGNISAIGNVIGGNVIVSGSGGDMTMTGGNITGVNVVSANLVQGALANSTARFTLLGDNTLLSGTVASPANFKVNDVYTPDIDLRNSSGTGMFTQGANLVLRSAGTYNWNFTNTGNLTMPGNVTAYGVITAPVALANLTAVAGSRAFINNANLAASGNFGAQVGSGGSNVVPVWSDGTNWYIG